MNWWKHGLMLGALVLSTGLAHAQNFSATPTNLNFGNVSVSSNASQIVTVTNISATSQTLTSVAGGGPGDSTNFGATQSCAGVTLAAGGTCQFTYIFHPVSLGAKSTSTSFSINGENFPITMTGTGVPAFTATPTNLSFGNLSVGASASQVVTVTNVSSTTQTLTSVAGGAPGDSTNFGAIQSCAGVTLAAGGTCQFTYIFHPTSAGAKSTSTSFSINGESFPITMTGTGVPAFTATPTNLSFGNVTVGASVSQVVTVTNVSSVSQTLASVAGGAPGDSTNFGATQSCAGVTLAAGGTCQFTYTFHPTSSGAHSSSTSFSINGQGFAITMAGTGVAIFSVAPASLDFGDVPVGTSSPAQVVTITNTSATSQTVALAGGAPADGANFGSTQSCAGVTLAPGGTCQFNYTFHPTSAGAKSSASSFTLNGIEYSVALAGSGSAPNVAAVPTLGEFGMLGLLSLIGLSGGALTRRRR